MRRSVSYMGKNSGIQTAIKVVLSLSFICQFTSLEDYLSFSIFKNNFYKVTFSSYLDPKMPDIPDMRPLNFSLRDNILFRPFSKILGKLRNLRVWPVGAVSKMIVSKSIFQIELKQLQIYLTSCEKDIAQSIPGTELKISLRRVFVPSSLPKLNTSYSLVIVSTSTFGSISYKSAQRYHCIKILNMGYWGRVLRDFLIEAITQIMGRISGDDQSLFTIDGMKSSQTAASGSLPNSTFSSNKNPSKGVLFKHIFKTSFELHLDARYFQIQLMFNIISD